jgi:hypothetical protein
MTKRRRQRRTYRDFLPLAFSSREAKGAATACFAPEIGAL